MKLPFRGVKNFLTLVVLYTAFSFCANTVLSEDNKFSVLEEFKVGEMKKLKASGCAKHEMYDKVAEKYGYTLVDHKLELYGIKKKSE